MTNTKQYDCLNRFSFVSSVGGASSTSPISFSYRCNDANQRIRCTLVDSSYWVYEYDSLGQVKSGKRYWSDGTPVASQQLNTPLTTLAIEPAPKLAVMQGARLCEPQHTRIFA